MTDFEWMLAVVVTGTMAWGAARDVHGKQAAKMYDEAKGPLDWPRIAMSRAGWIRSFTIIARLIVTFIILFWIGVAWWSVTVD